VRALHAGSAWSRLKGQLALVASARFRRRAGIARVIQNADKLL